MVPSSISGYPIILPEHRARFHGEHPDWHKAWLDSIHESLKPDDVVIDVGAEQGDLSALVASWVPDGGVWLVEPVAAFWPTIKVTFEANGLKPLGTCVAFGADETLPALGVSYVGGWPPESEHRITDDPGFQHLNERSDLASIRIDDLPRAYLDHRRKNLIIDVEGAELKVLHGAEGFLEAWHPLVWCAVHPEIMRDRYGHDPNELLAFMHRMGYRWELLAFAGELHVKFSPR